MYNVKMTYHECAMLLEKLLKEKWKKYIINVKRENCKVIKITNRELIKELGIKVIPSVVGTALTILESKGLIKVIRRYRYSGRYTTYIIKIRW